MGLERNSITLNRDFLHMALKEIISGCTDGIELCIVMKNPRLKNILSKILKQITTAQKGIKGRRLP